MSLKVNTAGLTFYREESDGILPSGLNILENAFQFMLQYVCLCGLIKGTRVQLWRSRFPNICVASIMINNEAGGDSLSSLMRF